MENFQALLPDLRLSLHWAWLGHHILINKPFTIRVLCTELCAIDGLLQVFSKGNLPWSIHGNTTSFLPVQSRDIVLILSQNKTDSENAIKIVAGTVYAYKPRYIVTHLSYMKNKDIKDFATMAWALRLPRMLVIRLEDRAVFATMPNCKLPRVFQVTTMKWPNLRSLDLTNCTLRVGMFKFAPFFSFEGDDEKTLDGTWKEFFRYAQLALNFNAVIVPTDFNNISNAISAGDIDMAFTTIILTPDYVIDIAAVFASEVIWCVPNTCKVRDISNVLWQEFSTTIWVLLVTSLLAVSFAVKMMSPPPEETLGNTVIRLIGIIAGTGARLPAGHARWPLMGWLLAVVVLGNCYQTVLHSIMTAPALVHEIENMEDLRDSNMDVACVSPTCEMFAHLEKNPLESDLEKRMIKVSDITTGMPFLRAQKHLSVLCSNLVCDVYFTLKRPLPDYKIAPLLYSLFGIPRWSWLVPAFRRISASVETSGLAGLWLFRGSGTKSCTTIVEETQPLGLTVFLPALFLMSIGIILGATAFVCEILCHRRDSASLKFRVDESAHDEIERRTRQF